MINVDVKQTFSHKFEIDLNWICLPIPSQCTLSLPRENIRKSGLFRGKRKGALGTNDRKFLGKNLNGRILKIFIPKIARTSYFYYLLITPNQQTLIETDIFQSRLITNQRAGDCKTAGNYIITPWTLQCRLKSIVWLIAKLKH